MLLSALHQDLRVCTLQILMHHVCDRVLSGWKTAKRAESKDRIKEGIDRFIQQLRLSTEQPALDLPPKKAPLPEIVDGESKKAPPETAPSWESKMQSFLGEVSWNG